MATADRASPASHGGSDGPGADRIVTARLELAPLAVSDAEEMVAVLGGEGLHAFTGGRPPTLRSCARYARLVGTVQATITAGGRAAEVAWVIAVAWQGQGLAATGELHDGERVWRRQSR